MLRPAEWRRRCSGGRARSQRDPSAGGTVAVQSCDAMRSLPRLTTHGMLHIAALHLHVAVHCAHVARTNGPLWLRCSILAPATVVAATPTRASDCGAWSGVGTGKKMFRTTRAPRSSRLRVGSPWERNGAVQTNSKGIAQRPNSNRETMETEAQERSDDETKVEIRAMRSIGNKE